MRHGRSALERVWILATGLSALLLTGCGSESDTGTEPTPTPTLVTETFNGAIAQNATSIHPFTVANSGYNLRAGFTSLAPSSITKLGIGIGSYNSSTSTCGLNLTQNDAALSGSTAMSGTTGSGSYCLRIYDGNNIPVGETASYTVQLEHY